jgi:hypothetical protein
VQIYSSMAHQDHYIKYSPRYTDGQSTFRHVKVPALLRKVVLEDRLLTEHEWRSLGLQQSPGWVHYGTHGDVLLFKLMEIEEEKEDALERQELELAQQQGEAIWMDEDDPDEEEDPPLNDALAPEQRTF